MILVTGVSGGLGGLILEGLSAVGGLEVAAATALWTSATILFFEHASDPPVGLVRATAGSAPPSPFPQPTDFALNGVRCTGGTTTANLPPTISLTNPTAGQAFNQGSTINIGANASDPDGTVTKVDPEELNLYQRVHVKPFADLRRVDFVQVLTRPHSRLVVAKASTTSTP